MRNSASRPTDDFNLAAHGSLHDGLRNKRVAVLSDALTGRNGVDTYYRDLVAHLEPWLEKIELLSPNPEDGELHSSFHLPMPGDATQKVVFPHFPKLQKRIEALQPHLLIAATNGPFGMSAIYLSHRLEVRLVVGFHTHIEGLCDMYWNHLGGKITRSYMELQNRLLFRSADVVVVNSHDMIEPAQQLTSTPVHLMETPLDHEFVVRPVMPVGQQLRTLLYAGRLAPEKNIASFVQSANELPHLQFSIAGDGPLRQFVEEQAANMPNLHYLGRVPRQEMVNVIDNHDMLVLPSTLEAFGTIALEGMVRARLVLVSSHCGILSWQDLVPGLYQYPVQEPLPAAIRRIETQDADSRFHKARLARQVSLQLHEEAIRKWLALLEQQLL
ncbi:MAG: hypothetical protein RLZZ385_1769 [Pseudomonadota bacterium]|jgi:glycosyltransferase involved in cell wall biosynthesis